MKKTIKRLEVGMLVMCMLVMFAGPATAALIMDADFNASTSSAYLRDNGAGQDWYESREDNPNLLTLDQTDIGGNSTNKAALLNYYVSNEAYLSQEFDSAQSSAFSVSFDIFVDRIADSSNFDRTGHIFIGQETTPSWANFPGPNSHHSERFVSMAFYDPIPCDDCDWDGDTTDADLQLRAQYPSDEWHHTDQWEQVATDLYYDTWYTITIGLDLLNHTYDVTVDDAMDVYTSDIITKNDLQARTDLDSLTHISFAADNAGRGDFYVDNTAVPAPGAGWLLASGLLGLWGVRKRFMK